MFKVLILISFILVALSIGCSESSQKDDIPAPSAAMVQKADTAVMILGKSLKNALLEKMEKDGVESALDFCSMNALELTYSVNKKLEGFTVKRTSDRVRNPDNSPDSLETEALNFFLASINEKGTIPDSFVQKFLDNDEVYYRYYKPIKIGALCLNCHGEPEKIAPTVQQLIDKNYPDDQAKDYKLDDFRGLFRAEFKDKK